MNLCDLKPGESGTVDEVGCCHIGQRVMEMGVTKGMPIKVLGKCPFGSCIRIQIGDSVIAIGHNVACVVCVSKDYEEEDKR